MKRILLVLSILSVLFSSKAVTIEVTSLADSGPGTLREALSLVESNYNTPQAIDTILVSVGGQVNLESSMNVVPVTLIGLGTGKTVIDGSGFVGPIFNFIDPYFKTAQRPLAVYESLIKGITLQNSVADSIGGACFIDYTAVTFDSVEFLNNSAPYAGGAIYNNDGYVYIQNSFFKGNSSLLGGAIYSVGYGELNVSSSVFTANEAESGGAIYLASYFSYIYTSTFDNNKANAGNGGAICVLGEYPSLYLYESTLSNNFCEKNGGAICLEDVVGEGGNFDMTKTTISNNASNANGGGIYLTNGNHNIVQSTITLNTASNNGGGVSVISGNVYLEGSVIAKNTAAVSNDIFKDINASTYSRNYNFIGEYNIQELGLSCECMRADLVGTATSPLDPVLGTLQDNGGLTWTHEPLIGSPLIDVIPSAYYPVGQGNDFDQRGAPFKRLEDAGSDIGAVEYYCDHIVDLTSDEMVCGTLREAINYANRNSGLDFVDFNLPKNSTIELKDSILITDGVYLFGHYYDVNLALVTDTSRIGIKSIGTGNGLVFSTGAEYSEVSNFNFQGFDGAAIKLDDVFGLTLSRNSFGTKLSDSTAAGQPNNIGVSITNSYDININSKNNNAPFSRAVNQFIGNGTGVLIDASSNGVFVSENVFSCNGVGIKSPYTEPVIDTIFPNYIKGHAWPFDRVEIFADTTCGKDQGLLYVGAVSVGSDSVWEAYNFTFKEGYSYVATVVEDFGEGFGNTSPFSAPQTVIPCDTLLPIAAIEICGDTLAEKMGLTIPFGYNVSFNVPQTEIFLNYRGDTLVSNQFPIGTQTVIASIDNGFCNSEVEFDITNYDLPDQANIVSFPYLICEDTLQLTANTPQIGTGVWTTTAPLMSIDDSLNVVTTIRDIIEGDSLYVLWNVSNGVCPVSSDSILVERGMSTLFDVTLVQDNVPVCSSDSIYFEANLNHAYDANDYIQWYVNGVQQVQEGGGDTLFSLSNLKDKDTVAVIYDRIAPFECYVQSVDTAELVLDILQQKLSAVEDVVSVIIGNSITVSVLVNDVIENQSISSLSFVGFEPNATVIGDTAILYNGINKGIDTVEYHVFSSCGGLDTALLIIEVINTAPVAKDTKVNVLSGSTVFVNVNTLFDDAENNFDEFSARIINQSTSQGLFTVISNMIEVNYSSDISYTGIDTLWVEAADEASEVDTVRIIFIVSDTISAIAGVDQLITAPTTSLQGNVANGYITYWTSNASELVFVDSSDALTSVLGFDPTNSPYELVWNISNGVKVERDTVLITVQNSAPIASDVMITLKPNSDTVIAVGGLFVDAENNEDNSTLKIESKTNPNANVGLVNGDLSISYTSTPLYLGVDTVFVSLTDVFGEVGVVSIIIDVTEKINLFAGVDFTIDTTVATLGATPVASTYTTLWTSVKPGITFDDPTSATTEARGFSTKEKSYLLVWTVSNGINSESDTVKVSVKNVAPVITSVDILVTSDLTVLAADSLIRDRNNNLAKTVRIITPFSFLSDSVVAIDVEALTITIDLKKDKRYNKKQQINDSLQYEICDDLGACDRSYIKVLKEGVLPTEVVEDVSNVEVETSFNFLSPNGDEMNETFFFNLVFKFDNGTIDGEPWYFVDEDNKTGYLTAKSGFETIYDSLIYNVEVSVINRWGDLVFEQNDYFGGKTTKDGEVFPDGTVWKGKDENGDYVTPGTYYYYILIRARKGADHKVSGFIEVRN